MTILFTTTFLLIACNDEAKDSEPKQQVVEEQDNDLKDPSEAEEPETVEASETSANETANQETSNELEGEDQEQFSETIKEEYLQKLNDTKKETNEMRENPADETTFALKEVEGNLYDIWDGLLNEIYETLQHQLSAEEMDQLKEEQRAWIEHRDSTAKEASLIYEGGTMEQLEYVRTENNLTEERCYELVEAYMK